MLHSAVGHIKMLAIELVLQQARLQNKFVVDAKTN